MAASVAALRSRALAYAERRLPALTRLRSAEPLPIRLDRRRIYVVPSRFGMLFGVLLFVMLIGALNYANNAALLMTCLFGAAGGASLFAGFRTMNGLELVRVSGNEVHAGTPLTLTLHFAAGRRVRPSLRVSRGKTETAFAIGPDEGAGATLVVDTERRGWLKPGRLRISTDYPLGLFRIWSWVHPDTELLVYPAVESPLAPFPDSEGREDQQTRAGIGEEHSGLRDYRPSDPQRLIAWKASARQDTLLVRDAEQHRGDTLVFDEALLAGLDPEARIRRLAAWVLSADALQRSYVLRAGDAALGPGLGASHRRACLRALALLPGADG